MKVHSTSLSDKNLKNVPRSVPDELLNEDQAKINHDQSLQRLNDRGGLGVLEMLDNIHKRKLTQRGETQNDVNELHEIISVENKRQTALAKAEAAYQDISSPHYRDNIRFSWAVETINKDFKSYFYQLAKDQQKG